jgi:hypothetical protein
LNIIERLLKIPYDIIDRYEVKPCKGCSVSQASPFERKTCDTITYGSIALGLQRAGMWPRRQPKDVLLSVEALAKEIKDVKIFESSIPTANFPKLVLSHYECIGRNIRLAVWGI